MSNNESLLSHGFAKVLISQSAEESINKSLKIVSIEGDSYKFHEQALEKLFSENADLRNRFIVPISVAGAMRTGKSYLLNYMLRYLDETYKKHHFVASSKNSYDNKVTKVGDWLGDKLEALKGFAWAHGTIERCTKGIHIWKDVYLYDSPTGEKLAIVLIDTQGIFDQHSTPRDNNVIFATSTLISSVQIYNVMQNINEESLNHLNTFADFGKTAQDNIEGTAFQNLVFLVRDSTGVKKSFGYEGGKIFLDERFQCDLPELQEIRQKIKDAFSSINCFLMPRLGNEEFEDEDYNGNIGALRPSSSKQLQSFIESILAPEKLVIKTINEQKVTMQSFIIFMRNYVKFFNTGETIEKTRYEASIILSICETAIRRRFENYSRRIYKSIERIHNVASLDLEHISLKADELKQFEVETKVVDRKSSATSRQLLEERIDELYSIYVRKMAENLWSSNFAITDKLIQKAKVDEATVSISKSIKNTFIKVGDTLVSVFTEPRNLAVIIGATSAGVTTALSALESFPDMPVGPVVGSAIVAAITYVINSGFKHP